MALFNLPYVILSNFSSALNAGFISYITLPTFTAAFRPKFFPTILVIVVVFLIIHLIAFFEIFFGADFGCISLKLCLFIVFSMR